MNAWFWAALICAIGGIVVLSAGAQWAGRPTGDANEAYAALFGGIVFMAMLEVAAIALAIVGAAVKWL